MRTLGINISHNASICQVTDGKIDFYYEEDRFNKRKYYAPKHGDCYFKVIDEKVKDKPDNVVVAAYDRAFLGETIDTLISEDTICCNLISSFLWNHAVAEKYGKFKAEETGPPTLITL